jgi:hypothetical protein
MATWGRDLLTIIPYILRLSELKRIRLELKLEHSANDLCLI